MAEVTEPLEVEVKYEAVVEMLTLTRKIEVCLLENEPVRASRFNDRLMGMLETLKVKA